MEKKTLKVTRETITKLTQNLTMLAFQNESKYFEIMKHSKLSIHRKFTLKYNRKHSFIATLENIQDYLLFLFENLQLELSTFILALIYIDRNPLELCLTRKTFHLLLFVAFVVALKINEDRIMSHKVMCSLIDIPMTLLRNLDSNFLEAIDYNLYVDEETYKEYALSIRELILNVGECNF